MTGLRYCVCCSQQAMQRVGIISSKNGKSADSCANCPAASDAHPLQQIADGGRSGVLPAWIARKQVRSAQARSQHAAEDPEAFACDGWNSRFR